MRDWVRVSRQQRCPVCDHGDWCLVAADGSACICPRTESSKRCGEAGWLHILREGRRPAPARSTKGIIPVPLASRKDFSAIAKACRRRLTETALDGLAKHLNVSAESLRRLEVGWNGSGFTFPMSDPTGRVIGIRIRYPTGRKAAAKGSRQGLLIPYGLDFAKPLLLCEGPTDTAALFDLGFEAVGRPSCTGGTQLLAELVSHRTPSGVVIVADGDGPGSCGAEALASALLAVCRSVRVIYPPEGVSDARAWKQAGATRQDVMEVIASAPDRSLRVARRAGQ